jgi:hypothetical protein
MANSFFNNFDEIEQIPRESLINLLKSDFVTDFLLDWASQQRDREIALAILINPKTSQQHLEKLFETFDNYLLKTYGYDINYYHYHQGDEYKDYKDSWDVLCNIEHHINWQLKKFKNNWYKNIIYEISTYKYPDTYWSDSLAKIVILDYDDLIKKIAEDYQYGKIYKNLLWKLRKLRKLPYKKKVIPQINQLEIERAKKAKSSQELEKMLIHKDEDFKIKLAVLENPYLTQNIFSQILENVVKRQNATELLEDNKFNLAFDKYPDLAKKFLESLLERKDNKNDRWHLFLAKCYHTPVYILEALSQSNKSAILARLAENSHTPEAILLKLAIQNDYYIKSGLRRNINLPKSVDEKLLSIESIKQSSRSKSKNYFNLAWNENTSSYDLKQIALKCDDYKVLINVVRNPNTDVETLEILSSNYDWEVRSCVAADCKTPEYILEVLAKDEHEDVRYSILSNPNLTKDLFYKLMYDINSKTDYSFSRLVAFLDPNVSPEILEKNASSLLWNERFAIAIHPKTPSKTVKQLAKDGNVYVREIAQQRKRNRG